MINGTAIKAADLVDGAEVQTLAGVPLTVQLVDGKAYFVDVNGRRALVSTVGVGGLLWIRDQHA